jgi:hypothetical protein
MESVPGKRASFQDQTVSRDTVRAGLTFRGARGILSARGPLTRPNRCILDTEFSKIKTTFCI